MQHGSAVVRHGSLDCAAYLAQTSVVLGLKGLPRYAHVILHRFSCAQVDSHPLLRLRSLGAAPPLLFRHCRHHRERRRETRGTLEASQFGPQRVPGYILKGVQVHDGGRW